MENVQLNLKLVKKRELKQNRPHSLKNKEKKKVSSSRLNNSNEKKFISILFFQNNPAQLVKHFLFSELHFSIRISFQILFKN